MMHRSARVVGALATSVVLHGCPRLSMPADGPPVKIQDVRLESPRAGWVCPGDVEALAGHAGDVVVVTGSGWTSSDVVVTVNGLVLGTTGTVTDAEIRARLPDSLSPGSVVVRSAGRSSKPSAARVCAAPPVITGMAVLPVRTAVCPGDSSALAGFVGDTLEITGSNWIAAEVRVVSGTSVLVPEVGNADDTSIKVRLPARLGATVLTVQSGSQVSEPTAQRVCVVPPFVTDVRLATAREGATCQGSGSALPGYAGDTLVITGGAWDTSDLQVELGTQMLRPRAGPDGGMETELQVELPTRLAATPVVVRSRDQEPATSSTSVCVAPPFITDVHVEPDRRGAPCVTSSTALPAYARDTLVITGGARDPNEVEVELGTQTYRLRGTPDAGIDTELRVSLPPTLSESHVVVRSADRDFATSSSTVYVAQPCITGVRLESPVEYAPCDGADGGLAGLAGDILVVSGGAWDPVASRVRLGHTVLPPLVSPDAGVDPSSELRVPLPAVLAATQVVVESPEQPPAVSVERVRVEEPRVSSVVLQPARGELQCSAENTTALPGFPSDLLTVAGCGWDVRNVAVVLGAASYAPLPQPGDGPPSSTHLQVLLPEHLPITSVQVASRQQLSAPSAQQVCVAGPGHLGPQVQQRGDVDPQVTITAAGTLPVASPGCESNGLGGDRDAGSAPCGELHKPSEMLAVAFSLGAYPELRSVSYLAAVNREGEMMTLSVLDAPDAGHFRLIADVRPFVLDPTTIGIAAADTLMDLKDWGTSRLLATGMDQTVQVLEDDPSLTFLVLNQGTDVNGTTVLAGMRTASSSTGHYYQSFPVDGHVGSAVPLPGLYTGAATTLERGWDPWTDEDGVVLDVACEPAGANHTLFVNRVTRDGGHWSNGLVAAGTPESECAAGSDCDTLVLAQSGRVDGTEWPEVLDRCARSGPCSQLVLPCMIPAGQCRRPIQTLASYCLDDSACNAVVRTGGACPDLPPGCPEPGDGGWPSMDCLRAYGCTLAHSCLDNPLQSYECQSVQDLLDFHDCVLEGGICSSPVFFAVRSCLDNPACRNVVQAGGPSSNCPAVAGNCWNPDGGGLVGACVERQGCLMALECNANPASSWRCPYLNDFVQLDRLAAASFTPSCGSSACRASRCATSWQCRATAECSLDPAACAARRECMADLCTSEVWELVPFSPPGPEGMGGLMAAVSRKRLPSLGRPVDRLCLVVPVSAHVVGYPLHTSALDVAVVPQRPGSVGGVMVVPHAEPPARELRVYRGDEPPAILATETAYRFLRVDPVQPQVYAVPQSGHRVDVLGGDGRLLKHTSVLGWLQDAILVPPPQDYVLLKYGRALMLVDPAGRTVALLPHHGVTVPSVDRAGIPTHAWTVIAPTVPDGDYRLSGVPISYVDPARPRFLEDQPIIVELENAPVMGAPVVAVWNVGSTLVLARLLRGWEEYRLGVVHLPQLGMEGGVHTAAVKWLAGTNIGYPVASSSAARRMALVDTGSSDFTFRLLDLAADPPRLVLRKDADGNVMSGADGGVACPGDGGITPCVEGFPVSVIVALLPSGAALGFFYRSDVQSYELGGITAQGYYATLESPPPFAGTCAVASPDGRHVYVGMNNSIVDLVVTEHDGPPWFSWAVERTIAIRGTPSRLFMDAMGSRLLFESGSSGALTPVE